MDAVLSVTDVLATDRAPADPALALLTREEPGLRRVIQRYVRDAATVDDVFQEVSLKVMRHLATLRDPQAARGWLFQLARHASLDHLRANDRRPTASEALLADHHATGDLGRDPAAALLSQERIEAVRRALDELPPSQREAIRLRLDQGLDHDAIARHLGISREAVEVRLCKGRTRLKERLDEILEGAL